MHIANPIYDVVFKYLLEDNKIAKLILSAIIGEEIEQLELRPQENTLSLTHGSLTVYRLDFSATIKTADGSYKKVIIEIQKAKYPTDIMRFRRYLGEQYRDENNTYPVIKDDVQFWKAMPVVSIYFLGHALEHTDASVIKVNRKYYDLTTHQEITTREEFIESLTHDSYVIQIPYLKERRRNELELLLSIFDQSARTQDSHILSIREQDYPAKYQEVIRRLQYATVEQQIRNTMDMEDEIVEGLQSLERALAIKDKKLEQKDKALEEKDKALEEKDKTIDEKDRLIHELQNKLDQQKS